MTDCPWSTSAVAAILLFVYHVLWRLFRHLIQYRNITQIWTFNLYKVLDIAYMTTDVKGRLGRRILVENSYLMWELFWLLFWAVVIGPWQFSTSFKSRLERHAAIMGLNIGFYSSLIISGSYGGHRRHTTDDGRRTRQGYGISSPQVS